MCFTPASSASRQGLSNGYPEYTIGRVINADGTVASETRRGFTTSFEYDDLGRVEKVTPPAGDEIVTEYDNVGGATVIRNCLDRYAKLSIKG
jgi:YD repeat-containing protein